MKKLLFLLALALAFSGCGKEMFFEQPVGENSLPWSHMSRKNNERPVIMVNEELYYFDDYVGINVLPKEYSEAGSIVPVADKIPENNLEILCKDEFSGKVFIGNETNTTVYIVPDDDEKHCIRFACKKMMQDPNTVGHNGLIFYGGRLYIINYGHSGEEYYDELPKGFEQAGSLVYIGVDNLPQNDFESNMNYDNHGASVNNKKIYTNPNDPSVVFVSNVITWSEGTIYNYLCCPALKEDSKTPNSEQQTDSSLLPYDEPTDADCGPYEEFGGIRPAVMANGKIYYYCDSILSSTVPKEYSELGPVSSVSKELPEEELAVKSGVMINGNVFAGTEDNLTVYIKTEGEPAWAKNRALRFICEDLVPDGKEMGTNFFLKYGKKLYVFDFSIGSGDGGIPYYTDTLPEDYNAVGSLVTIGIDNMPKNDFETNKNLDYNHRMLKGKTVYANPEKPEVIYFDLSGEDARGPYSKYIICRAFEE